MSQTLMQQGLDLMIFGMGTVFIFLSLLVVSTYSMSKIVQTYFAEPEEEKTSSPRNNRNRLETPVEPRILSAIQAAITEHRQRT